VLEAHMAVVHVSHDFVAVVDVFTDFWCAAQKELVRYDSLLAE